MTISAQLVATSSEICDSVEQLRQILVSDKGQPVSYEEALEIGESLLDFYKALAGDQ